MSVELPESVRALVDGRNFATLVSIGADGSPHASVMWVGREGDTLVFSTKASRLNARNLRRDPRATVSILDLADPYHSVEIRGIAELVDDPDKRLPDTLSHKYLGTPPPFEATDILRVVIRVTADKVREFSP